MVLLLTTKQATENDTLRWSKLLKVDTYMYLMPLPSAIIAARAGLLPGSEWIARAIQMTQSIVHSIRASYNSCTSGIWTFLRLFLDRVTLLCTCSGLGRVPKSYHCALNRSNWTDNDAVAAGRYAIGQVMPGFRSSCRNTQCLIRRARRLDD